MPKLLPRLYDRFLQGDGIILKVDTQDWFDWLRNNNGFSVEMPNCHVTFKKETRGHNEFWYAMRKVDGRLRRKYVGHTGVLMNNNIMGIAKELAMYHPSEDSLEKTTEEKFVELEARVSQLTQANIVLEKEVSRMRFQLANIKEEIENTLSQALTLPANKGGAIKAEIRKALELL